MADNYKAIEMELPGVIGRVFGLDKNGQQSYCPFQQPMQAQTNLGIPTLFRMPCHTGCHFAEMRVDDSVIVRKDKNDIDVNVYRDIYCVSCSGTTKEYSLTAVILKDKESKIVTMGK